MNQDYYEYDVFVSHAFEDKEDIVNELVDKLKQFGIKVWYSGHELAPGDTIEEKVKDGLRRSRHGIVIFTHNFFKKSWTRKELSALWLKSGDRSRIFPVWHQITEAEIRRYDPNAALVYGVNTKRGMDETVARLIKSIYKNSPGRFYIFKSKIWNLMLITFAKPACIISFFILVSVLGLLYYSTLYPYNDYETDITPFHHEVVGRTDFKDLYLVRQKTNELGNAVFEFHCYDRINVSNTGIYYLDITGMKPHHHHELVERTNDSNAEGRYLQSNQLRLTNNKPIDQRLNFVYLLAADDTLAFKIIKAWQKRKSNLFWDVKYDSDNINVEIRLIDTKYTQ